MSAELLYQRSKAALEKLAHDRMQDVISSTVDVSQGNAENIAMTFVQHKATVSAIEACIRALVDEYTKLVAPEETKKKAELPPMRAMY